MARVTGLEPAASGVTGRRSNQLSYTRVLLGANRRFTRIGLPPQANPLDCSPTIPNNDSFPETRFHLDFLQ